MCKCQTDLALWISVHVDALSWFMKCTSIINLKMTLTYSIIFFNIYRFHVNSSRLYVSLNKLLVHDSCEVNLTYMYQACIHSANRQLQRDLVEMCYQKDSVDILWLHIFVIDNWFLSRLTDKIFSLMPFLKWSTFFGFGVRQWLCLPTTKTIRDNLSQFQQYLYCFFYSYTSVATH